MSRRIPVAVAVLVFLLAPLLTGTAAAGEQDDQVVYYLVPGTPGSTSTVSLKDVSAQTMGTTDRWREIVRLNKDVEQPDKRTVADYDGDKKLPAGWRLELPAGARTGEILLDPGAGRPPGTAPPAGAQQPDTRSTEPAAASTLLGMPVAVAVAVGAGVLLLVLGGALLLVRRRSARPAGAGAAEPPALPGKRERVVLDRALHQLPASSRIQVYAAVVGPDRVALRMTPAAPVAQPPWQAREQGAVWEAPVWQLAGPPPVSGRRHPFPLLAPMGTIGGENVLVDLGRAPGLIAIVGDRAGALKAATRILDGVGADPRSAGIAITIVGQAPPGTRLPPARRGTTPDVQGLLGRLNGPQAAPDVTGMLGGIWGPGTAPGFLVRHLVVVTTADVASELELLGRLAAQADNTTAVLVVGDHPNAAWRFGADAAGALDLGVLGLQLDSGDRDPSRLASSGQS